MITELELSRLRRYCREPIENIKGYREAVESENCVYHCHHINELTFTRNELRKMKMLYHRPASELIIMTRSEHKTWHEKWNGNPMKGRTGEKAPMYRRSGEKHPGWKGDNASVSAMYRRAKNLYKSGQISEEEFQPFRALWAEYQRARRKRS